MELVLEDITKKYKDKTAVQNVSATLHSGQLIGLIGKNGAGKTTLLKLLSTILKPAGGRILLDGQDIVKNPNVMRSKAGYLPQEVSAYPNLTVLEYLSYIASVKGIKKKDAEKQINSLLTDFHLENAKGRRMGNCSGGMKQRAGIICALLGDPQIIIIDEPATGLDPEERVAVRNILSRLSRERIVILSTHIVSDIEYIANEILLMKAGQIVHRGTAGELIDSMTESVWKCCVHKSDVAALMSQYKISNMKTDAHGVELRIISKEMPIQDAVMEEPSLEDVFLYYFGEKAGGNDDEI